MIFLHVRFNTSLTAYLALKWSTLVLVHGINKGSESCYAELPKLVEAQAALTAAALACGDRKLCKKVYRLVEYGWKTVEGVEEKYVENLTSFEASNGLVVLASLLINYLAEGKKDALANKLKVR